MTSTYVCPPVIKQIAYTWRQRLGRHRGKQLFEIQFLLHYFPSHQIIMFNRDLLFEGFNVEHLISEILWLYGLPPQSSIILHKHDEEWECIEFEDWHQGFLSKPAYIPVPLEHFYSIISGKVSNDFFALKTEKLVPKKAQASQ